MQYEKFAVCRSSLWLGRKIRTASLFRETEIVSCGSRKQNGTGKVANNNFANG